ncbi:MAG: hypothetical protein OXG74_00485 [Acidobacteria bacterium]|nr:hypothetical protein [Acidobacteriota bacterium]
MRTAVILCAAIVLVSSAPEEPPSAFSEMLTAAGEVTFDRWNYVAEPDERRSALHTAPWVSIPNERGVEGRLIISITCYGWVRAANWDGTVTQYSSGKTTGKRNGARLFRANNQYSEWAGREMLVEGVHRESGHALRWRIPFGPDDKRAVETYFNSPRCRQETRDWR